MSQAKNDSYRNFRKIKIVIVKVPEEQTLIIRTI